MKVIENLKAAVVLNPQIVVPKSEVKTAKGLTEPMLAAFGLTRKDLKRLERKGLAIRAYTQNIFPPREDEKAPDGKSAWAIVPVVYTDHFQTSQGYDRKVKRLEDESRPRYWYRGKGHQVKWIIFAEALNAA